MKSVVKSAKTIELAVEACLKELKVDLNDCVVTVLEQPKSGIFGLIGQKDAIVRLELKSEADELSNFVGDILDKNDNSKNKTEEVKVKKFDEDVKRSNRYSDNKPEREVRKNKPNDREAFERLKKQNGKDEKESSNYISGSDLKDREDFSNVDLSPNREKERFEKREKYRDEKKKDSIPTAERKDFSKSLEKDSVLENKEDNSEKKTDEIVENPELEEKVSVYVKEIIDLCHIEADVKALVRESGVYVDLDNISEEDVGIAIGRKAETLNAIQYITNIAINRKDEGYNRVFVNIVGYRERRKEKLEDLARSKADIVARTKRPISLKPMNAYERRIIHFALQNDKRVFTISEGKDPFRKIVIKYQR